MYMEAVFTFNQNRSLVPVQILCIVEHIACLILEDVAGYVFKNKTGKMPTSK